MILRVIFAGMVMKSIFKVVSPEVKDYTINDHKMIIEFIKKGDAAGAEAAMRMHLMHAYNLAKEIKR